MRDGEMKWALWWRWRCSEWALYNYCAMQPSTAGGDQYVLWMSRASAIRCLLRLCRRKATRYVEAGGMATNVWPGLVGQLTPQLLPNSAQAQPRLSSQLLSSQLSCWPHPQTIPPRHPHQRVPLPLCPLATHRAHTSASRGDPHGSRNPVLHDPI